MSSAPNSSGWARALGIGTGVATILAFVITLGMCPKISEIQTTIEAKGEHDELERRVTTAAQVQTDRLDAVLVGHKQLIDQQRTELREYRLELQTDRQLHRQGLADVITAIERSSKRR